jgi:hypothetical protein
MTDDATFAAEEPHLPVPTQATGQGAGQGATQETPRAAVPGPRPAAGTRIDGVLAALAEVKDAPPAEQVGPLTEAHRVLRETLESIGDV